MSTAYVKAAEELRDNAGQWQAYESTGNCVILAGPGSGKTKTITLKIARLLNESLRRPRRLACITYSNACVSELRIRLEKLGVEEGDRLLLSTVHSFCLTELVLPYATLAGIVVPEPLVVASQSESRELFRQACIRDFGFEPRNWFRIACEKVRRTVLDRESDEWRTWAGRETAAVEAYEARLLAEGLIDFDGLVMTGLALVEKHDWVRRAIQAKYPIIVIDEYQDLGLPLHRIVLALMLNGGVRIIAVGDPDQSIYGFTGAQPGLLRALGGLLNVESIRLELNYRCANRIIDASQSLLIDPGVCRSHDGHQGEIHIQRVERDLREQADYVLGTILPNLLENNQSWKAGDIALLYRSLNEGTAIAEAADALGMEYFRLDNGSPVKRTRVTEWLIDAANWCSGGWQSGNVSLSSLLKSWKLMRRSLIRESDALAARARLIRALFTQRDGSVPLRRWLTIIRDEVLRDAFNEEPGLADERDNFEDLLEASHTGGPLEAFTVEIFGNQGKSPNVINFMTLHSSKGLEFQTVIMIGLEEGIFPSIYDRSEEELEEAKRLFYVGITRAKSQVFLIYENRESPLITTIRLAGEPEGPPLMVELNLP